MAATAAAAMGAITAYAIWRRRLLVRIAGQGFLLGSAEGNVVRFLGVPFASADARWRPPGPAPSWILPRRNPERLLRCPQPDLGWNAAGGKTVFTSHRLYEDEAACLNLNVWAPCAAAEPCPIVVYIHGGAGKLISPHDDDFNGEHLVRRHGVVYVALSYRLGALGFMAHPALSAEDEAAAAASGESVASGGSAGAGAGRPTSRGSSRRAARSATCTCSRRSSR